MGDAWLHTREEEILRPYREPPCDDIDSWVTERGRVCECNEIQETLKHKRLTSMMASHLILSGKNPRVECRTVVAGPFSSPHPNSCGPSPTQEVQPLFSRFYQAHQPPEHQEPGQETKEPASPLAFSELITTFHSPATQCSPGYSPSTHNIIIIISSSSSSNSGFPEETSQGQQELLRRFLDFKLKKLCFRPSAEKHSNGKM